MSIHPVVISLAVPLLLGANQQQPKPTTPQPTQIIPFPIRPRENPSPAPKPKPPAKSGIVAPTRRTDPPTPNPTINPNLFRASEPLDLSGWTKVEPADAGFTIHMPAEPEEKKRSISAGERNLELVQHVLSMDEDGAYLAMSSEVPGATTTNAEAILRAARDRVVSSLAGQLLDEQSVRVSGVVGLEVKVRAAGGTIVRQRFFVNGDRLIQAIVAGTNEFVRSPDADKYLRSMRIQVPTSDSSSASE